MVMSGAGSSGLNNFGISQKELRKPPHFIVFIFL